MKEKLKLKNYEMNKVGVLVLTLLFILMFYDLYLVTFKGVKSSVSNWITNLGDFSSYFRFFSGVIVGHLFLPMKLKPESKKEII